MARASELIRLSTPSSPSSTGWAKTVPSATHGKKARWRARYVDDDGHEHTRAFARKRRDHFDAILVGISTVLKDNPSLNAFSKSTTDIGDVS